MTPPDAYQAHTEALRFGTRKEKGIWRRIRFFLQDHPTPLVWTWKLAEAVLKKLGGLFTKIGVKRSSRWIKPIEELVKKPIFDCQMCGQWSQEGYMHDRKESLKQEMTLADWKRLVDEKLDAIGFTDGQTTEVDGDIIRAKGIDS